MTSVMQTANEMETEMVKLLCKYMESVMRTADEMRTEIVTSAKNTSVMALSQGQVRIGIENCSVLKTAYILPDNQ